MKGILFLTIIIISSQVFASTFGYFSATNFFGSSVYNRVIAEGEKPIKFGTAYGGYATLEYGLETGLRIGAVTSFDNLALQTDFGSLYSTAFGVGLSTAFSFDLPQVESVVRVSGGLLFVILGPTTNLSAIGLAGEGFFEGRIYFASVEFAKVLTDYFSISAGGGVRFYDLYITTRNVVAQSMIIPINLTFNYRF